MTPIGVDVVLPDAAAGARRVAPDAARSRAPQTPWVGERAPFVLQSGGPVPAASAAVAVEPRMGRRVQRDQGATGRATSTPAHRPDGDREVLDGERDPPVQPPRRDIADAASARARRDRAAGGDGQRRRRRRADLGHERQVPLPVLAPGDGDRPDVGHGATASARCPASTTATRRRSSRPAGGRSSRRRTIPSIPAAHGSITSADGRGVHRVPRHDADRRRHPRLRPSRAGRQPRTRCGTSTRPTSCAPRSSTPASGAGCTTASRA